MGSYDGHECGPNCSGPRAYSTDESWAGTIEPRGTEWCFKLRLRRPVWNTGEVLSGNPKPCDGWRHRDCAEAKAHRLLVKLQAATARYDRLWLIVARHDDQLMPRIRDQRRRAGGRDGFWVKRADGMTVMVFPDELPARIPPKGTWKTPEEVMLIMSQVGLRLPGVAASKFLGGWRGESNSPAGAGGDVLGSFTDEFMEEAFERAADIAERLWKVRPQRYDLPLPPEIPTKVWFKLFERELRLGRNLGGGSHG